MNRGTPMSNSTARKRLNPEPLPHWVAEVCRLIEAAKAEAWDEGANAAVEPYNAGTHMTLRAVIPFPENPYRAEVES